MAVGSGIAAQWGMKSESVFGTLVTVDKFLPVRSINITNDGGPEFVSKGLRAGRRFVSSFARGVPIIGGTVPMELPNVTIAPLLKHCFGTVATTGAGPYTHTFTLGSLTGVSFTSQGGIPSTDGTVNPFTWGGCKVPTWEISATVDDYVLFTPTISAKTETTGTSLATASYAAGLVPFTPYNMTLTVGGSSVAAVNAFKMTGNNGLKTDRKNINSTSISEQIVADFAAYTGTIDADFTSLSLYADFLAATQRALVVAFTNGTDTFTMTANIVLTGSTPAVTGPDIVTASFGFRLMHATSDASALTAVLVNTDASAA